MLVYNKISGNIIMEIPDDQNIEDIFYHYPTEFKVDLETIGVDISIRNLNEYIIVDGKLHKRSDEEIHDLRNYGKVLTVDERLLESMKPSIEEVINAERTIELISLLQEVL